MKKTSNLSAFIDLYEEIEAELKRQFSAILDFLSPSPSPSPAADPSLTEE